MLLSELGRIHINNDHFVARDCVLKWTDYVFGVVTYVGTETKIMFNQN